MLLETTGRQTQLHVVHVHNESVHGYACMSLLDAGCICEHICVSMKARLLQMMTHQ